MEKNTDKNQVQYIQPYPYQLQYCEEDEIDLKELIKTILRYKKIIFTITAIITLLATIYAFVKTPVYEIEANFQMGYTINDNAKNYFIAPYEEIAYIETKYPEKKKEPFPKVKVNLKKNTKDILHISIQDHSNKLAIKTYQDILKDLNKRETNQITHYKKFINSQLNVLKNSKKSIENNIKTLKQTLASVKDSKIYDTTIQAIKDYTQKIEEIDLQINEYLNKLSPTNIKLSSQVGSIISQEDPIKPKKILIIIVAFITSLILSIFLVFFLEFIKSFKEDS